MEFNDFHGKTHYIDFTLLEVLTIEDISDEEYLPKCRVTLRDRENPTKEHVRVYEISVEEAQAQFGMK